MNRYSTFPKAPGQEPHHHMVEYNIHDTCLLEWVDLNSLQKCSRTILQLRSTRLEGTVFNVENIILLMNFLLEYSFFLPRMNTKSIRTTQHILFPKQNEIEKIIDNIYNMYKMYIYNMGGPRGVMVKAMDCRIVVCEFVLESGYYVHFRANTLGKGMNPLILPTMG